MKKQFFLLALFLYGFSFLAQAQSENEKKACPSKVRYTSCKVIMRCQSSIQNTGPLYVIDGFPFSHSTESADSMKTIDPNTIKSIKVLKGAAAMAIYGTRATNGVIIITTRKAKQAPAPEKMNDLTLSFKMLSNPVAHTLKFRFSIETAETMKATVYNMGGKEMGVVFEEALEAGTQEYTYNVSGFPPGMYLLKIDGISLSMQERFMIE